MKKKILFCIFDLKGGGAEKVLINLLRLINSDKYEITVLTIFRVGVHIIDIPENIIVKYIFPYQFKGCTSLMKLFSPNLLHRLFIRDKYDVEIAYLESSPTRIISGAPKTVKKVCWVHIEEENKNTFASVYRNYQEMIRCYNQYDHIAFVSKKSMEKFESNHPEIHIQKSVIYNVNDYADIIQKGKEQISEFLGDGIKICTVGRLCKQKGYQRLLEIVSRLNSDGLQNKFCLYILGIGEEYASLKAYIAQYGLKNVTLLGYQLNPYKYLTKMDLFVCSSYKEGYSTAVTEAIVLNLPVITTDVSGMDEILHNGDFGMIVNNDTDALYQGLKELIFNPDNIEKYKKTIRTKNFLQNNIIQYEQFLDTL